MAKNLEKTINDNVAKLEKELAKINDTLKNASERKKKTEAELIKWKKHKAQLDALNLDVYGEEKEPEDKISDTQNTGLNDIYE